MEYRSEAVGILYAEEFGLEPPAARAPPPPPEAPAPRGLTRADLDAACDAAVAAARAAWVQGDAARRAAALEALAAGLEEIRAEAGRHAESVAESLAGAALGAVAALLPHLASLHGAGEVRALAARLLPALARAVPVVVRVHASLVDGLRGDVDMLGEDVAARVEVRPANLPPGDARLDWPDGSVTRDAGSIQAAITEGFAQLGLLPAGSPSQAASRQKEFEHAR